MMSKSRDKANTEPNGRKKIFGTVLRRPAVTDSVENAVSVLARRGWLRRAARLAVQKQFARGVPAVWMENGVIYRVYADGHKEVLATRQRHSVRLSQQRYYIQK